MRNIRHFYDDGYSGTNFNHPGFAALLEEIEASHVKILSAKDLSRFGRNYLEVGYYTEILFPKKGVRFIAINDNVDSNKDNIFRGLIICADCNTHRHYGGKECSPHYITLEQVTELLLDDIRKHAALSSLTPSLSSVSTKTTTLFWVMKC